ncbi:MAG: T9SS type A sorting domain-containing protein [candidate division Zixibacteria bacterium]|nr:T9SS type A sorting domain-containing protein [candidate division Zixibacteria bacterium]
MKKTVMFLALILFLFSPAFTKIYQVPSAFIATIQGGINVAKDGDTVLVMPGVYYENINFKGKKILLASRYIFDHQDSTILKTIIDGSNKASVVTFNSGEDSTASIQGFTIRHGINTDGGGIFCQSSSPKIAHNIIRENVAEETTHGPVRHFGAGICCFNCSALIEYNKIVNNQCVADLEVGGGGGGIFYWGTGSPIIRYNLIAFNRVENPFRPRGFGGGINYFSDSIAASIYNNTIVYNYAGAGGGGIFTWTSLPRTKIYNNIIALNSEGIRTDTFFTAPIVTHNDFWQNVQGNFNGFPPEVGYIVWGFNLNGTPCDSFYNIIQDPLFVDWANDFHLRANSPCIDAGDPKSLLDPDSTIADIGAFYYPHTPTFVKDDDHNTPKRFELSQNYPNPFNPTTKIQFRVGSLEFGDPVHTTLKVYNILGQLVRTLVDEEKVPGNYEINWDGKDDSGKEVGSGIYFYQLKTKEYTETKKMVLLR